MAKDFIIHNIDENVHREFKVACAHFDLSMRATLIKHMQNIVNDYYKYKRGFTGPDLTKSKVRKK